LSVDAHGQNGYELRLKGKIGKGCVCGFGGQLGYFDSTGGVLRVEVEEYPVLGANSDVTGWYGQLRHHFEVFAAYHGFHICEEQLSGELAPEAQSGDREINDRGNEEDEGHYSHRDDVLDQDGLD